MADDTTRPLTLGEYRVGISFNPSNNPAVDEIKEKAAAIIDIIEEIRVASLSNDPDGEIRRLCAIAMTHFEEGAMNAVKAATKTPRVLPNGGGTQSNAPITVGPAPADLSRANG